MSDDALRLLYGVVLLALIPVVYLLIARSWRRRRARGPGTDLPEPARPGDPAPGEALAEAVYVSTTVAGRAFERVAAHGLGARSGAGVGVVDVARDGPAGDGPARDAAAGDGTPGHGTAGGRGAGDGAAAGAPGTGARRAVVVRRDGAPSLLVPAEDVVGVARRTGQVGKFVAGRGGLVVMTWRLGGAELDTALHLRDPRDADDLVTALGALVGPRGDGADGADGADGGRGGAVGTTVGEMVFCTAMTGYQETITDPSYHRQVVMMTAPHVGNTGWNDEDDESRRIWVAGFVVRDPAVRASSWRSRRELAAELADQGVVGIAGVDTRALTRRLRSAGVMRAGIFSGEAAAASDADLLAAVRAAPPMAGADLASEVSTPEAYVVPAAGERVATVAALDLGIKSSTPRELAARGVDVHVLPASASMDDVLATGADAVFFSNGPGDPGAAVHEIALLRDVLERRMPFFGICYGNQLLGRALGLGTYKLPFGHRGVNQPVLEAATGRVEITSQNHGFAVDAILGEVYDTPYGRAQVSHTSANDGVVEGLRLLDAPAFSVQYHPEAAAGPHDANHLFDRFVAMVVQSRES